MENGKTVCVYLGDQLGRYAFGENHPFGPHRLPAFEAEFRSRGLERKTAICPPREASEEQLRWFHTPDYIERVKHQSRTGEGYLDHGDTPAFRGVFEAGATVVGSVLDATDRLVHGECRHAFVPIAGLHHARRDGAAGFCVFNDCGIVIEALRRVHGIRRIAYVDIDAHHGDGVFYGFEDDPELTIIDFHEDGRYLYPGTGSARETGRGAAAGTKLNVPMPPDADDDAFFRLWDSAEAFLLKSRPEFILLQCGADGLAGDPITHLRYSAAVHAHVTRRLVRLAGASAKGRLLALGGGGYNLDNLANAWNTVVAELIGSRDREVNSPE